MLDIKITKTQHPKEKQKEVKDFGKHFTDHMFIMNYETGKGWYDPRIVPYGEISLEPSCENSH